MSHKVAVAEVHIGVKAGLVFEWLATGRLSSPPKGSQSSSDRESPGMNSWNMRAGFTSKRRDASRHLGMGCMCRGG